jgi:hypothetical protein
MIQLRRLLNAYWHALGANNMAINAQNGKILQETQRNLLSFIRDHPHPYLDRLKIQAMLQKEAAPQQGNEFLQYLARLTIGTGIGMSGHSQGVLNQLRRLFDDYYNTKDPFWIKRFLATKGWSEEQCLNIKAFLWREVNAQYERRQTPGLQSVDFLVQCARKVDQLYARYYPEIPNGMPKK